jgi:glycosyltransferase involved in cell wall biosynthesis
MSPTDGGPTAALVAMTDALLGAGVAVTIATTLSHPSRAGRRERIAEQFPAEARLEIFPDWPLVRPVCFSPRMFVWINQHARDFDVVHIHSLFNWQSLIVPTICHERGVPFVVRPLGTLDSWSRAQKSWKKRPYFAFVEERNLRRAARVHVTSDAERQSLAELGFGAKTRCIPLGIELPALRRNTRGVNGGLRVLFLSRIHPKKNLPLLLRAIAEPHVFAHPPTLTVVGDGAPGYLREMHELVRILDLEQRVRFTGFLTGDEKDRAYEDSDVFVLPSFQENFGVSVAEAMARGLPVVISAEVALAQFVVATGAGKVVTDMSPVHFARALATYEDPGAWRAASAAARALVAAEFSTRATADGLVTMYEEICASSGTSA